MPVTPTCQRCRRPAPVAYRMLIGPADRPQTDPITRTLCPSCAMAISREVPDRGDDGAGEGDLVSTRPVRLSRPRASSGVADDRFRRAPA